MVKNTVSLSPEKVTYKSLTITKKAQNFDAKSNTGKVTNAANGAITVSTKGGSGAVGWAFTLPKELIYKTVVFKAYASGELSAPSNIVTMQNFVACPSTSGAWNASCFENGHALGNSSGAFSWFQFSGKTRDLLDRLARGAIFVNSGSVKVQKVEITLTYGVLH